MGKRGSQQGRPSGGGGRNKGMYSSAQYSSTMDEELHWAQNGSGWKPARCKTPPKTLSEEEVKTEVSHYLFLFKLL